MGPYRIQRLEEKNVTLTDLATGKTVHSHEQFIRPVGLAEYCLLLSKEWDLNAQLQKADQAITHPMIFDAPTHPFPSGKMERQRKDWTVLCRSEIWKHFSKLLW